MRQLHTCRCFRYNTRKCRHRNNRAKRQRYQYSAAGRKPKTQGGKYNNQELNKANNTSKINELETQVKNLQKSLTETNRKISEKTKKYIN